MGWGQSFWDSVILDLSSSLRSRWIMSFPYYQDILPHIEDFLIWGVDSLSASQQSIRIFCPNRLFGFLAYGCNRSV